MPACVESTRRASLHRRVAQPAAQQAGPARPRRPAAPCAGGNLGAGHDGGGRVHEQQRCRCRGAFSSVLQRVHITFHRCVADDVHRVGAAPGGWQSGVERGCGWRRSSGARATPATAAASAAITPAPPPLVIERQALAVRRVKTGVPAVPFGLRRSARQRLGGVEQVLQRVHAQHAGTADGGVVDQVAEPASAPVCEAAAAWPMRRAPGLDHQHRLVASRRARGRHELARRRRCSSMYSRMARVCVHRWPASRACRRSRRRRVRPARRSARSRCRGRAPSPAPPSPARPTATRRPACRGVAPTCAKVALSPACGAIRPRQLGPRMRSRWRRAASSMACFCLGVKPAVSTTAACVCRGAPVPRSGPPRCRGGVQMTARSGACGQAGHVGLKAGTPPTWAALVGSPARKARPARRPRTLRQTVAPTLDGLSLAPMTATERGSNREVEMTDAHGMPILRVRRDACILPAMPQGFHDTSPAPPRSTLGVPGHRNRRAALPEVPTMKILLPVDGSARMRWPRCDHALAPARATGLNGRASCWPTCRSRPRCTR